MTALTLYEINDTLAALLDSIDMCETDEQRASCEAEIAATMEQQVRKVDDFCRFLAHLEAQQELAKAEIQRLRDRNEWFVLTQMKLEAYAVRIMQQHGKTKLEGDTAKLSLRNSTAVEIADEEAVPAKFKTIKQTVTIDKRAVRKALDAGEDVPGADVRFGVSLRRS